MSESMPSPRCNRSLLWLLLWLLSLPTASEEQYRQVEISAPFIELQSGPGRAFPAFHAVARGERVEILMRRTDWFKLRTHKGVEGWVHLQQLSGNLDSLGEPLHLDTPRLADFRQRRWEAGLLGGYLEGAALLSGYGGFAFSPNLSAELSLSHALGNFSSQLMADINLLAQPFPEWPVSPFFTIGTGLIHTRPRSTLVQSEDRTDQTANVGLGAKLYLGRRFMLRGEYKHRLIFTSRDDNEEYSEWKLGVAFFF
jgi:hypothetical protein